MTNTEEWNKADSHCSTSAEAELVGDASARSINRRDAGESDESTAFVQQVELTVWENQDRVPTR